jgi:hypothetical protein
VFVCMYVCMHVCMYCMYVLYGLAAALNVLLFLQFVNEGRLVSIRRSVTFTVDTLPSVHNE